MHSSDIRQSFLEFFRARGHEQVPSSPLVPPGDPTLLFTNAGMVQFKRVFQGLERRSYNRAVTVQKCVRAGGKHNDLEQVGHTARHHTFFEMLGNFSFGDYFKKGAIELAWEWVTSEEYLGIHPDRIYVSVHHTDDEARRLWREVTGLSDDRIYGLGDADNFWQMGDTGPCGPCSEIYVDLREGRGQKAEGRGQKVEGRGQRAEGRGQRAEGRGQTAEGAPTLSEFVSLAESGELLEIWNLVFMQYDQAADGTRTPLPAPSVDTGAGLERIAAVMQGVGSNFETDLFVPIIERARETVREGRGQRAEGRGQRAEGRGQRAEGRGQRAEGRGQRAEGEMVEAAYRVLADHSRAVAFLLADGVYPSNEGRGYVLRRILRRAVRYAYLLGRAEPLLDDLTGVVVRIMGEAYPELSAKAGHIRDVTRAEEERFLETIAGGLKRLDQITGGTPGTISGEDAFKLYDTYGFPIDLTQLIAAERGWRVDAAGFEKALGEQRERGKGAGGRGKGDARREKGAGGRGKGAFVRVAPRKRQRFVGYESTRAETEILAFRQGESRLELVLQENPFYAESGGQVSDTGVVKGEGWELPVEDVVRVDGKQVVVGHFHGPFEPTQVEALVAEERRRNIERNHTATHLVHAALRKVLGTHVRQAGSVVAPDRLRFDFSHHAPVSDADLRAIEEEVNRHVWENLDVETRVMDYHDALAAGAMALFGEKYGDRVRVVDVPGVSLELCGGTHVRTTGQIGLFQFSGETGVAAGVRRIEALTGPGAYQAVKALDDRVEEVAQALRTGPEHVARRIEQLLEERRRLENQVEELLKSGVGEGRGQIAETRIGDTLLVVGDAPVSEREQIGLLVDAFRAKHKNAVQVWFSGGDRPGIHVGVSDDLIQRGIKAGDLVNRIAAVAGGRGGGRPHFASAGVGNPTKLGDARREVERIVAESLGGN